MGLINNFKQVSTFLSPAPSINLTKVNNFSSDFFCECWNSNPGQLDPEASMLTIVLCCPPPPQYVIVCATDMTTASRSAAFWTLPTGPRCSRFCARREVWRRPCCWTSWRPWRSPSTRSRTATRKMLRFNWLWLTLAVGTAPALARGPKLNYGW